MVEKRILSHKIWIFDVICPLKSRFIDLYPKINETISLDQSIQKSIWTPDLMFKEEEISRKHVIMREQKIFDLNPDGTILSKTHITLKIRCIYALKLFPFDTQICPGKGQQTYILMYFYIKKIFKNDKTYIGHRRKSRPVTRKAFSIFLT